MVQGGSGDEQGVPALVSGDSPSLWTGVGAATGSALGVSVLSQHRREGWLWPVMGSCPDGSGSLCCSPSRAADTAAHIMPFLPVAKTRPGRTERIQRIPADGTVTSILCLLCGVSVAGPCKCHSTEMETELSKGPEHTWGLGTSLVCWNGTVLPRSF